jgi:acyl carrier protein
LNLENEVIAVLGSVLNLGDRIGRFTVDTPLLGAVPELDSMAVVSLLTSLEERFGIAVDDDEVDGSIFSTVGSLARFVEQKVAA